VRARPLALAMLVAAVGHGLWLGHAELRLRRQPLPQALRSRDDSPELLEFSRLPPEPLAPAPIPLPPEETSPPPPPLPEKGSANSSATAKPQEKAVAPPAAPSSSPRGGSRVTNPVAIKSALNKAAATKPPASEPPAIKPPASKPAASRPAVAQPTAARPQSPRPPQPPGQREEPSLTPLRRLAEARRKGPPRLHGERLQSWRSLWQGAEAGTSPPAALVERGEESELRRIPLATARADGLEPSHGEVLRLDDHLLLAWIDGSQLWLLRAPA
jgi:hypothetical protein